MWHLKRALKVTICNLASRPISQAVTIYDCIVGFHLFLPGHPSDSLLRFMPRSRRNSGNRKISPPAPAIDSVIHLIRGERVILDADLAKICGVETKALNQAVKRNR